MSWEICGLSTPTTNVPLTIIENNHKSYVSPESSETKPFCFIHLGDITWFVTLRWDWDWDLRFIVTLVAVQHVSQSTLLAIVWNGRKYYFVNDSLLLLSYSCHLIGIWSVSKIFTGNRVERLKRQNSLLCDFWRKF